MQFQSALEPAKAADTGAGPSLTDPSVPALVQIVRHADGDIVWSDQMTERMKVLYAGGQSHARIAAQLNSEFKTSVSRNAIIGKAHRLGLEKRGNSGLFQNRVVAVRRKRARKMAAPSINPEPFICQDASEIVPLHIELKDLAPDMCRWPYGTTVPYSFCGHAKGSRWYCASHYQLSTRTERAAHR